MELTLGADLNEMDPIDTCDLPSDYEWRYRKLQVIVFGVVFRSCMCTCLSVAHISPTVRKSIPQAVKLSKIMIKTLFHMSSILLYDE